MFTRAIGLALAAVAVIVLAPAAVSAQSAIAGVVKDTSGATIPGVTVEASSPALIEGVRSAITDEQGQYRIIDLRPGVYTVAFTLTGFSTLKREGIELPTNFTAAVNGELRVGGLEETITVSGGAPIVDVQQAVQQQVLPQKLLDAVPTGGRNFQSVGAILVGISQSSPDVGGGQGMQQTYVAAHGSDPRDNVLLVDGMPVNGIEGDGAIQQYFNEGMFAEMSYQTGGVTAETSGGGVRVNMIPKDGGNVFKGDLFTSYTNHNLQAKSITDELQARGLRAADSADSIHDFNVALGGPIKTDRLWFFSSWRHWGVNQNVANAFFNLDSTHRTYQPDTGQQVIDNNNIKSGVLRLTTQLSQKHKVAAYLDRIVKYRGHEGAAQYLEEAFGVRDPDHGIYYTAQAKYTGTLGSRLLVEFGWSGNNEVYTTSELQSGLLGNQGYDLVPRIDINGNRWSAVGTPYFLHVPVRRAWNGALSYVTGSHAIKAGMLWQYGFNRSQQRWQQAGPDANFQIDLAQRYSSGVPNSVIVYNTPVDGREDLNADLGIFLQDSWTRKRLTVTPGVRFEHFNTSIPEQSVAAGRFVAARRFDAVHDLPNWNDIAPRLGVAYDLFGNGKTALKGSISRYMVAYSTVGFAQVYNPMFLTSDIRTWRDTNGDDLAQDTEIGPTQIAQFGARASRNADPDIKRPYNIEYTTSVQQQLWPGVSASFGYFRRSYKRIIWSDNTAINQATDYTPIVLNNPVIAGETVTVFSLKPEKLGLVNIVDKNSDVDSRVFNGIDVTLLARLGGATLFGGMSTGRNISNNCDLYLTTTSLPASDPNALRYCDQTEFDIGFLTQYKMSGTYPLPYDLQVSGTFQSYPGTVNATSNSSGTPWLNANWTVTPANAPGLTQSSLTIPVIPPGSKYLDRWNQLDFRLTRKFKIKRYELQGQLDLFNVLNSHVVIAQNQTVGSRFDQPTQVLQGRLLTFGGQLHF